MNSDYIKAALSAYYRFSNQCSIMATEVGRFNSDFLVKQKNNIVEVEIKTSRSDLNADFKKKKHLFYTSGKSYNVPNMFYFAVPEHLLEYAISKCIDKKYGVMLVKEETGIKKSIFHANSMVDAERRFKWLSSRYKGAESLEIVASGDSYNVVIKNMELLPWKSRVRIVKRAKMLHTRLPDQRVISTIISRLSSEMANLRGSNFSLKESIKNAKAV